MAMDGHGMKIQDLESTGADIAYVTPSHQYPTGIVMPIGRRMELLKWAYEKDGRYIIEDDYDSEFRFSGKPIPTMVGMDSTRVMMRKIKSFTLEHSPNPSHPQYV